jgi:hypothetical protein
MRLAATASLLLALACQTAAHAKGEAAPPGPRPGDDAAPVALATQSLLPLFLKTDWTASSFSPDGRFLLVVDESRSFILDAAEGRELRSVRLPAGEIVLWSRALPGSGMQIRWAVTTNLGRLLIVDGSTGATTAAGIFPPEKQGETYRKDDFVFELVAPDAVVINIRQVLKPKPGAENRAVEGRKLIWQPLSPDRKASEQPVWPELHSANLNSILSANTESHHVALASREGTRVAVWRLDGDGRPDRTFRLRCVYDGNQKVRAIAALGRGFVIVDTAGTAFVLNPDEIPSGRCTQEVPMDPADARCKLASGISVIAGRGSKPTELVAITKDYSVLQVDIALDRCTLSKTVLGNVREAFFAVPIYRPGDLKASKDDPEWNGFIAAPAEQAVALVAGASLMRVGGAGTSPAVILNLAGRPTGALEVESGPGFILASRSMAPLRVFDLAAGRLRTYDYDYRRYFDEAWFYNKPYAIAGSLGALIIMERDGRLRFHEAIGATDTAEFPVSQKLPVEKPTALCSSADGRTLWVLSSGAVSVFRLDERRMFSRLSTLTLQDRGDLFKISCAGSGTSAVASDSLSDDVFVLRVDRDALRLVQRLRVPESSRLMARPTLSTDSRILAVGSRIYVRRDESASFSRHVAIAGANKVILNDRADLVLAAGTRSHVYRIEARGTGARIERISPDLGNVEDGAYANGLWMVLRGAEHLDVLGRTGRPLGRLVFGDDIQWLFTDNKGRFDTYDSEGRASAYWVMKDDPMRALDPELFMRDYLEPRLLPKLAECTLEEVRRPDACLEAFPAIRPVEALNRARPRVEFVRIDRRPASGDTVNVRLRVSGTRESRDGVSPEKLRTSGAFDLHLRLNGQLVARRPIHAEPTSPQDLAPATWRGRSRVATGTGQLEIDLPGITLPHLEKGGDVEFSAYAFNDDRVKGPTLSRRFSVPASGSVKRRAFVVAIGSSAYQDESLDLRYPAEDARALLATVVPALRGTGRFSEIVTVSLTSDWDAPSAERRVFKAETTKARIRQVLEALGGTTKDPSVAGRSTPDDTVIILFSGHGLNHAREFYLVPYDSGRKSSPGSGSPPLDLARQISSAELSHWLRDLVADEIILVIDACHSSASVESADFKPGPMGARGFGQLAYDKGMRVLASTRPNDLAWESPEKGQGLLSYALLQEGLMQRKADRRPSDGTITVSEWLQYAVDRVPVLYGETSKSGNPGGARLVSFDPGSRAPREVSVDGRRVQAKSQQPTVFDFRRGKDSILSIPTTTNQVQQR